MQIHSHEIRLRMRSYMGRIEMRASIMSDTFACDANIHMRHGFIRTCDRRNFRACVNVRLALERTLTDYEYNVLDCDNAIHKLWFVEALFTQNGSL